MCDLLRSLKGELEVFGGRSFPGFDGLAAWHPVERVVDLDTIQTRRIILQELLVGEAFGIENRPPFFIAEAGGTEPNRRHSGIIAQVVLETRVNIGQRNTGVAKNAK